MKNHQEFKVKVIQNIKEVLKGIKERITDYKIYLSAIPVR